MSPRRHVFPAFALVTAVSLGAAAPGAADELALRLDPAATNVSFVLPATGHDVSGAFALREGAVRFDPATGAASGRIAVEAAGAKTGNGSRDKTMHQDVLESGKYPLFVFVPASVEGAVPTSGKGKVTLVGTLTLHGADHPFRMPAEVEVHDGVVRAHAQFDVPFLSWGLHDPSVMFLRVADTVKVSVDAKGSLGPVPATVAGGAGGR